MTFFTFASTAKWRTVYRKQNENYIYNITIESDKLDLFTHDEEVLTSEPTGTIVSFYNITDPELTVNKLEAELIKDFCWYLELNKDNHYSIYVDDTILDYSPLVVERDSKDFSVKDINLSFSVDYVCWAQKLSEYSKYYYLDSNNITKEKEYTTFNNKGDSFYHSIYIRSSLFDKFNFTSDFVEEQLDIEGNTIKHKKGIEYRTMMNEVNRFLFDKRRPFLKKHVSKVIESIDINSAFPNSNENDILYRFRKNQIEEVVSCLYVAQPKIFSTNMNKEQKKTFVRLLDLIMESGEVSSLFSILNEILELSSDERKELAEILNYSKLSNITKTIKLIQDRAKAVEDLKQLVFNDELNAKEVPHLQKMIEMHYWLFGESYNLVTAAEPNFEQALRAYLKHLHKEYLNATVEHPDRLKQMDIFAIRQNIEKDSIENIVIELKHPRIALGETQLSQVKKYMSVIMSQDQFNASNMTWEFYLVGNRLNNNGYIESELENSKSHGERSLVFKNKNYKIYVKTWSEIFADFKIKHDYLLKKLDIERSKLQKEYPNSDSVVSAQAENSAIMQ